MSVYIPGAVGKVVVSTIANRYAYDANGHELNPITTYADGTASGVTYTYDKLGRIKTMSDGTRSYIYDSNGNLTKMQVLNGSNRARRRRISATTAAIVPLA